MADNTDADARTEREPTRFDDEIDAETFVVDDRISRHLVGRHPDEIGSPRQHQGPDIQLVTVTAVDRYDDVHSAVLYDPDRELFVRASRHARNQAMTQAEADWTVRGVGTEVVVEEVAELERPDNEQDESAAEYAQHWVEILFDDISYGGGEGDSHDEMELSGSTLTLRDYDGRELWATISLE
jgi:hypothetical protein